MLAEVLFKTKNLKMEIGKYKLEVIDGIINITPSAPEYYRIAESIANELSEGGTTYWREICLKVINILNDKSQLIKSKIVGEVSYGSGFYPISLETVKGRKFEESKAFVEGYSQAVEHFRTLFECSEESLIQTLDNILPSR